MKTTVPEIRIPFPYQLNPYVEQARADLGAWTHDMGLIRTDVARERFERADNAQLAALTYPTVSPAHLVLMASWLTWAFLLDDHLDTGRLGRSPQQAQGLCDHMCEILRDPGAAMAVMADPDAPRLVSSLADLWTRSSADTTAAWRGRYIAHLTEGLNTLARWETVNRVREIVPTPEAYVNKRRHTGDMYAVMDLIGVVEQVELPPDVYDSPQFTAALDAACNVVVWTNDVYSLDNERSGGEVHNLVRVVEHHDRLDRQTALARVSSMIVTETEHYLGHEMRLLRTFPEHASALVPYAAGMRSWMRGNLDWSIQTDRYRPQSGPHDYLEAALVESGQ